MQALRMALGVATLVLWSGCESVDDVIAKRKPGVEKTFAALRALGPKVVEAQVAPPSPLSVPLVLERGGGKGEPNAMFIYAADLARPGFAAAVNLRTLDSVPLLQCGALLEKRAYFGNNMARPMPSVADQYLGACERLRYVLVIREKAYVKPALLLEARHFDKGRLDADVLAYDVTSGALVGGYSISATNDERVSLLDGDADHVQRLITNLESTAFNALRDGAKATFPGAL